MTLWTFIVLLAILGVTPASSAWASCGRGASGPLAATNARGEILTAWEDAPRGEQACFDAVAAAAVGSPEVGFTDLGMVSTPGRSSFPKDVFLDDPGNGWVIGINNAVVGAGKYTPELATTGVWVAFRPAGGRFQAPIELPWSGTGGEPVLVTGNQAGVTLLAWSTTRGSYLAWGSPAGTVSAPRFVGHGFQLANVGVDDRGRALVIGYYPSRSNPGGATSIVAITGQAYGAFSRARVVATQPRNAHGRAISLFERPLAAIGPTGDAIIVWETWRKVPHESPGPSLLVYRDANSHFTKPRPLAKKFLDLGIETPAATVDAAGRALIVRDSDNGWQEVAIAPGGHVGPEHPLQFGADSSVALAGNELGQTLISATNIPARVIHTMLGNTLGTGGAFEFFDSLEVVSGEVIPTLDSEGRATVIWVAGPYSENDVIDARTIAPGAPIIQVTRNEPVQ
jgi:hypothetical protein